MSRPVRVFDVAVTMLTTDETQAAVSSPRIGFGIQGGVLNQRIELGRLSKEAD